MLLGNPNILQPDILNIGGVSEMMRIYETFLANNKVITPHSPNSLASLHAYSTDAKAVLPHEFSEEFTGPAEGVAELFEEPMILENGKIRLSDRPGLGLELEERAPAVAIAE